MTEQTDTVTPLDGDGQNVVDPTKSQNVAEEDFETKGRTTVATPRGYRFESSNHDLPVIHSGGVKMTKEQAQEVVDESNDLVFVVSHDESEED